jgi:hypothetical protein
MRRSSSQPATVPSKLVMEQGNQLAIDLEPAKISITGFAADEIRM